MRISDLNIDRVYINSLVRQASYNMVQNHFHYYYELFYVRHGNCRFFVNDTFFDLMSGDFIMIPPREIHYTHYLSQCTRINIYFTYRDLCDYGTPFFPQLEERFLHTQTFHVPRTYRDILHGVLDQMLAEEKVDDADTPRLQNLLLRQLLLYANRYCGFNQEKDELTKDADILKTVQYITEHFNQPITLEKMAKDVNLSPSYFSKKFRQTIGMGMKSYLTYIRLTHASMELLSTSHSIMDVAMNCGFSDSNYFKDAFKKMYGVSPRAYRNSKNTDFLLHQSLQDSRFTGLSRIASEKAPTS